jgi:hypothetical protein
MSAFVVNHSVNYWPTVMRWLSGTPATSRRRSSAGPAGWLPAPDRVPHQTGDLGAGGGRVVRVVGDREQLSHLRHGPLGVLP